MLLGRCATGAETSDVLCLSIRLGRWQLLRITLANPPELAPERTWPAEAQPPVVRGAAAAMFPEHLLPREDDDITSCPLPLRRSVKPPLLIMPSSKLNTLWSRPAMPPRLPLASVASVATAMAVRANWEGGRELLGLSPPPPAVDALASM